MNWDRFVTRMADVVILAAAFCVFMIVAFVAAVLGLLVFGRLS